MANMAWNKIQAQIALHDQTEMKNIKFTIKSDPSLLEGIRSRVEYYSMEIGFDAKTAGLIVLAVDEVLTNIIRHAYNGDAGIIEVEFCVKNGDLCFIFRDFGDYIDPLKLERRPLEVIAPGGLGVHIINKCVDSVEYLPAKDVGTVTILKKKLPDSKMNVGDV